MTVQAGRVILGEQSCARSRRRGKNRGIFAGGARGGRRRSLAIRGREGQPVSPPNERLNASEHHMTLFFSHIRRPGGRAAFHRGGADSRGVRTHCPGGFSSRSDDFQST